MTIEKLLGKLEGVKVVVAGTGSIYVYHNDKKVRVADHEPNYTVPNRGNDRCFYTRTADNQENDIYSIVQEVADYLGIEIKGYLKGMITKHINEEIVRQNEAFERVRAYEELRQRVDAEAAAKKMSIKEIVEDNEQAVMDIIAASEGYGAEASNGDKRRKRTRSMFRRLFSERFGVDVELALMREVLKDLSIK